ncbi:MAG TPA: 2-oxoglutarate dehydrogenase E1 component [Bacteroidia bacterium]
MDKFSYTGNGDPVAIEGLYEQYLRDPKSVDETWQQFFEGIEFAGKYFPQKPGSGGSGEEFPKEFRVVNLINTYRTRGHLFTKTNPVRQRRSWGPPITIEYFGLQAADLEQEFDAGKEIGIGRAKLKDIITHLEQIYCNTIGFEFMYCRVPEEVEFIKNRIDVLKNGNPITKEEKLRAYEKLSQGVLFEKFLGKKFVGQKRFSLEGGEALIPGLDALISNGSALGIEKYYVGMAHRGRLNVLANIFEKPYEDIFVEFEGHEYDDDTVAGDVKYHLGYTRSITTEAGKNITLSLLPNPSHLETVAALVEGISRSSIDAEFGGDGKKVCPIVIHGDAAIAGQGIVYEIAQMQSLEAYKTGGTVHIVINNQVGFTTNYTEARSSIYCTDIAKVTGAPVFHVNGDDTDAMIFAMKLALEYRQQFNKDVYIDLLCYRKFGHNEGDEPRFTQPQLYKSIDAHPDPRTIYVQKLIKDGVIDAAKATETENTFNELLEAHLTRSKERTKASIRNFLPDLWNGFHKATQEEFEESPEASFDLAELKDLAEKISSLSPELKYIRKIQKIYDDRANMVKNGTNLDWAMGELLAYATLLTEGHPVRISGQDSIRGTFSHRHAIVKAEDSEQEYCPLNNLGKPQAKFSIYNSHLSEYAVMGFEYGYALGTPNGLTIWEAQFGDFVNGAQIIIDQYLTAAEDKWTTQNGLVLLLPHGFEGMGAEHSSARLERFLQLCAELNIQVVNCTTPANMYHVLRRQLKRNFRKPLVIFTPKSLLRHPKCISSLEDLATGKFKEVLDDTISADNVEKVVFCSGKLYYELLAQREATNDSKTAIVRLEQLYPFPMEQVTAIRDKYVKATKWIWAQEEPENMGAWWYIRGQFTNKALRDLDLEYVGREASASPATGSPAKSAKEQQEILSKIFQK